MAKDPPYMPVLRDLDQSRIVINGDTATVPPKHSYGNVVTFKKEGGIWKLEAQAKPDVALRHAIWAGNIADVLEDVATGIDKGRYTTAKQAQQAYSQKMDEAANKGLRANKKGKG